MGLFSFFKSSESDSIEEIRKREEQARLERIKRGNMGLGPDKGGDREAAAEKRPNGADDKVPDYYKNNPLSTDGLGSDDKAEAKASPAPARRTSSTGTKPGPTARSAGSDIEMPGSQEEGDREETVSELPPQQRNVSDMQYRRFAAYIEQQSGIVLGSGKQYLVNSRLSTLLIQYNLQSIDDLINKAMNPEQYKDISISVIDAMTTNETLWFRDTYPYMALKNVILPELAKKHKNPVRIWSAACSSGQEPYSIAMVVQEQAAQMVKVDPATTQIVGTDLSPQMLERCRAGLYDSHALARGLSGERKSKFFKPTRDPNVMVIDDKIKSMVTFRQLNLLSTYALLGKFDVIFCRNVLIYFSNEVKSQILNKFAMNLNPGGYLILGSSESINGLTEKYDMVRFSPGLGYRLKPPTY